MIKIRIHYQAQFGQALYIGGSSEILGQWVPHSSLKLTWTQGDLWEIELPLHDFEYKYFLSDFEEPGEPLWEAGPNRHFSHTTSADILDAWNHRRVKFQCQNPQGLTMFVSGSCLGNYCKRVAMRHRNGISYHKCFVNVLDDQEIYYQFHVKAKREYTSQIQILRLSDPNLYEKSTVVAYCDGLRRIKSAIYQLDPNICYGYVPSDNHDFSLLKKANLKTIVEFSNSPEPEQTQEQKRNPDFNYMVVNLRLFNESNLIQRLFNFIQILVQRNQTIYICNNSLSHLKKYLQVYQNLIYGKA